MFEKCNNTQDSNSIKARTNVEITDITSKLTSITEDPIDFRTGNPLDPLKSFSKAIMLKWIISISPVENVKPESLTNDTFSEELSHPQLFATEKVSNK